MVRIGWVVVVVVALAMFAAPPGNARVWTEEDFIDKPYFKRPLVAVPSQDSSAARTVVGESMFRQAQKGDTFLDLARYYGLGYNEISEANPGVDPWVPPVGQTLILPTEWVLPRADYRGIVVNIPEMRLYYFHPTRKPEHGVLLSTYPVGLGRDDWKTPTGRFKVRGKTENPTWIIPASIRAERVQEKGYSEALIPGGSPDNPLGSRRIELTLPMYTIHGTNIPWGVGMQVSHGCIRLYPEDVEHFFPMVPVGAPGEFVYQPVKIGARGGDMYVEVHRDIYGLTPGPYQEAMRLLDERGWRRFVDLDRLKRAVTEQSGVPMIISPEAVSDDLEEEVVRLDHRKARRPLTQNDGRKPRQNP